MNKRNANLDIIRIIAILFVVLVHIQNYYGSYHDFARWGLKGVPLFFILSGYLALKSLDGGTNTKDYYIKRIIRIVPTYYIVLVIVYAFDVLCELIFNGKTPAETFGYYGIGGIRYCRYFLFLNTLIPSENGLWWNNRYAFWTMPAFALFYLMAPCLSRLLKKTEVALITAIFCMLAIPYASEWLLNLPIDNIDTIATQNPIFQIYAFILGIAVYNSQKEHKEMLFAAAVIVITICTGLNWYGFELLFSVAMIVAVNSQSIVIHDSAKKIIKILSDSSFTVYLLHGVILNISVILVDKVAPKMPAEIKFSVVFMFILLMTVSFWRIVITPLDRWFRNRFILSKHE